MRTDVGTQALTLLRLPSACSYNGNGNWPQGNGTCTAGGKMGKAGQVGGYYHYHKIMFQRSIRVVARTLTYGLQVGYMIVRGHEVARTSPAAVGLTLQSGFTVPPNARLQLQRIDNVTYQPLQFAPIATVPRGYAGLLYLTTFATVTAPAGNNYIEGCWHLYTDANMTWPGVVLGTGVEDFFDSAYWFCALGGAGPYLFAHPNSGLLHFSRETFAGADVVHLSRPYANGTVERISAYRFFDAEVVGFSDGGGLRWRVGDVGGKCSGCPTGTDSDGKRCAPTGHPLSAVAVRAYAWVYTWPLDDAAPPAPNFPPIACPNATVCGGGDGDGDGVRVQLEPPPLPPPSLTPRQQASPRFMK